MKSTAMDEMIKNVVEVVFYSKYYYITDPDLKEDLIQEGNLAAYTLLASGEYNPTKDLRNYMYSWVWNAMSNYLYKQKKEKIIIKERITVKKMVDAPLVMITILLTIKNSITKSPCS